MSANCEWRSCSKERAALKPLLPPDRSYFSLERYMKCAIGLCGQCTCNGYRVCTDGPVFDGVTAQEMTDIGFRKRRKSGGWEYESRPQGSVDVVSSQ